MKFILWSVVSSASLLPSYALAQAQRVQQQAQPCQLRVQQPRTDESKTTSSSRVLLAAAIEEMCNLNEQQPRTDDGAIATNTQPSPENFTIPSLWWQQQQIGDAINSRLIDSWRAYGQNTAEDATAHHHVDVVINNQIWPLLDYLERYSLIAQFGESAKAYGYQLRVFTGNRLVGLQVCDFTSTADISTSQGVTQENVVNSTVETTFSPMCAIELNYFGQGAIRGGRQR